MLYRKPRVGQELNAYCGKCKDERTHIVAAMDGEIVRRVTCSMCGSTHNYKVKPAPSAEGLKMAVAFGCRLLALLLSALAAVRSSFRSLIAER